MSKTVEAAIAEIQGEIAAAEASLSDKKNAVNVLCGVIGREPAYRVEKAEVATDRGLSFQPDAFYGEPLASSAKRVLEASKTSGAGSMSLDALYEALKSGGFAFDAKSDATARRSLAISLSKNTAAFVRLPSGDYGLKQWYKRVMRARGAPNRNGNELADEVDDLDIGEGDENEVAGLLSAPATSEDHNKEDWDL